MNVLHLNKYKQCIYTPVGTHFLPKMCKNKNGKEWTVVFNKHYTRMYTFAVLTCVI